MSNPIQIVDENDKPIAVAAKQEAWAKGLRHRIVRIMIIDDSGDILLQRRSPDKDIFPDCWDNSAAGHVEPNEEYLYAALRELKEELGLDNLQLKQIGKYASDETVAGNRFKRFTTVYEARSNETPTKLEHGKVSEARWFKMSDLKQLIVSQPDKVSDGLRQVIELYY